MARNLSPVLRRELANLEKDADSRKSAMRALKSYVKDLDSKAIPQFLAQVSGTKDAGSSCGEYTISLYEVLARVHGPNIVSQIDIIMGTIIRTLTTSAGSFPLQQACSKVVPAIARYAIEPATPEDKKRRIIHSLCRPLSDSLIGSHESLSCGAALCLKALVDCDNWRFASEEMVSRVCSKLAGALKDRVTQTNSHMGLVMSLAKRNTLIVEDYANLLIQSGLEILNAGAIEKNSQKRLTAIQMINFLMKCLDIRCIYSELELIIEEMEKCQSDQMPYVAGAAFEALQTARKLVVEKVPKFDGDVVSVTGSNYSRRSRSRARSQSPKSASPESQTLESFADYGSLVSSSISTGQASCNVDSSRKSINRKLWNGGVDISLKDGIFSEILRSGGSCDKSELTGASGYQRNFANGFDGFYAENARKEGFRSQTPSPQRPRSHINADTIKICSTPRKLVRSLQDQDDEYFDFFKNQARIFESPCSVKSTPLAKLNKNGLLDLKFSTTKTNENSTDKDEDPQSGVTSATASEGSPVNEQVNVAFSKNINKRKKKHIKISGLKTALSVLCAVLFVLLAFLASAFWVGCEQEGLHLVPT